MSGFKEWHEATYESPFPAVEGEEFHTVFERLADAVAKYVDEIVDQAVGGCSGDHMSLDAFNEALGAESVHASLTVGSGG